LVIAGVATAPAFASVSGIHSSRVASYRSIVRPLAVRHVHIPVRVEPRISPVRFFNVNTKTDTNAVNPASGHCTNSAGHCSLRAAVQVADALGVPVSIKIHSGVYALSQGPLVITDPAGVSITGSGPTKTSVSGGGTSSAFVVEEAADVSSGGSTRGALLDLDGVTVRDGLSATTGPYSGEGGAFVVGDANDTLELSHDTVTSSSAGDAGGGVFAAGELWVNTTTFSHDTAVDNGGAISGIAAPAIRVTASSFTDDSVSDGTGGAVGASDGDLDVSRTTFTSDSASSGYAAGGAVDAADGEQVILTHDTFNQDSARTSTERPAGGAVALEEGVTTELSSSVFAHDSVGAGGEGGALANAGYALVSATTFKADSGTGDFVYDADTFGPAGGAIFNANGLSLTHAHLIDNSVAGEGAAGGALYNDNASTVQDSVFTGDTATGTSNSDGYSEGGGIFNDNALYVSASDFTSDDAIKGGGGGLADEGHGDLITGSTFEHNRATGGSLSASGGAGYGGGVYGDDSVTIVGSVVQDNSAAAGGGGVYEDAPMILNDSTVSRNRAPLGAGIFNYWTLRGDSDAIVDNTAPGGASAGGGVLIAGSSGTPLTHRLDLTNSVIAGNVADVGAGIDDQGGSSGAGGGTLQDVVVAANHTPAGAERDCGTSGSPAGLPVGSAGGNVAGDTSCHLGTATDRQGPSAQGYWLAHPDGTVGGFDAPTFGHLKGSTHPVTALAVAPGNTGYWELTSNGSVHAYGSANSFGSAKGRFKSGRAVALLPTLDGRGYWVVTSHGKVIAFGDAQWFGSAPLGHTIVGAARTVDGNGYWLLSDSGKVYAFGDAGKYGNASGHAAAIAATPDGAGYWVVSTAGEVSHFGDAAGYGSSSVSGGVAALVPSPNGGGYLIVTRSGKVLPHGNAVGHGGSSTTTVAVAAT
jgi:hypothetical protein